MDHTPERHCELLSAWIDGEPTDPADVHTALETPEGRAFLVDAMSLRRAVDVTSSTMAREMTPITTRQPSWWLAAAVAIVFTAAGYGVARVTSSPDVAGPSPFTDTAVVPVGLATAPQPTHVIRFESGVDWRETSGGN